MKNIKYEPLKEEKMRARPVDNYTLIACWQLMDKALEAGQLSSDKLLELQKLKCVPNVARILNPPEWMFFEDRAGLAPKFGDFCKANVIPRPLGAWKAMTAAGVRTLGSAVDVHLLEYRNPSEDALVSHRIRARREQLARVLVAQAGLVDVGERLSALEQIRFEAAEHVQIQYTLRALGQTLQSKPEICPALFQREDNLILFVPQDGRVPWPALARELAFVVLPDEEPGRIAPGLKDVLAAETVEEAQSILDELGFATLETVPQPPLTSEEAVINILGGGVPPPAPLPPELNRPEPTGSGLGLGSGSGSGRSNARKSRSHGRLRSYVVEGDQPTDDDVDSVAAEHRTAIDNAGIANVVEFERAEPQNRNPIVMPPKHPGYDIESKDSQGTIVRYIEVKSLSGDWDNIGVSVSKTQFAKGRELGERYWLYVVERADQPDAKIHCIQNPVHRVDQFFFDDGWSGAAETSAT